MKLNKTKAKVAGLTLIEITLVIAVLLGLISVLFIGVSAYREGSNRSKCILTISNVQKAVRSYQNLYELNEGDALVYGTIVGSGKMLEVVPECGSQSVDVGTDAGQVPPDSFGAAGYVSADVVPVVGVPFLVCNLADQEEDHEPNGTTGW